MRQFLLKLGYLAGALLVVFSLLFILSSKYPSLESRHQFLINQLLENANNIEALNLGNSHSAALDFDILGLNGYHIMRGGEDLFEMKYKAKTYVPYLENLKTVFICISYHTFFMDHPAKDRESLRIDMYNASPSNELVHENDYKNFLKGKIVYRLARTDYWKYVWLGLAGEKLTSSELDSLRYLHEWGKDGRRLEADFYKSMKEDSLVASADKAISHVNSLIKKYQKINPQVREESFAALEDIINYLQQRDIRIICYTPTYYKNFTEKYTPEYIETMKSNMSAIVEKYNIQYYYLSTLENVYDNPNYFYDSNHLNYDGASVFTQNLKSRINAQ